MGLWKSRCGWRFGGVRTVATWLSHPTATDAGYMCLNCVPAIKARLKTEFAALAASLA